VTASTPSTPAPTGAPGAVLLDTHTLATQVHRLANEIARDHPNGVVLIGVLKGSLIFLADLARAITDVAVTVDFLAISRYAPDSGRVRILMDLTVDVTDRDVVIVEDLVDTGLTLAYLLGHVRGRAPARVEVCTLFDRPERRIVPLEPRYIGAELAGDAFVIGYGLHVGERYRNLPVVVRADPAVVSADPDAYLDLYGAPEASKRRDARVDRRRAAP
jgi:hypoxanthine phosphoribosyltransferase